MKLDQDHSINRLYEICYSLKKFSTVKAIIAFGSLVDVQRFDAYSDLDFIVLTNAKGKKELLSSVSWLIDIYPIEFEYFTSKDSMKVIYSDGVICDFGILTEEEFSDFEHGEGKLIWNNDCFIEKIDSNINLREEDEIQKGKILGDIISNLYIGMLRFSRGELLSAYKLIQNDNITLLIQLFLEEDESIPKFKEYEYVRRLEFENESLSIELSTIMLGYNNTPEAASNTISLLEKEYRLPIYQRIETLIQEAKG
ncbi:hypothetical protein [Salipaludibacillus sp. CF4.18]|uniref:hypothetical protein n=1 Tax=Salipaludibacillus sp. CF4.18 TaxID=3373081 RepID=UPI003EE75B37